MSYGEHVSDLRRAMTALLERHRILQPLGGPGSHTVPETTSVEERRIMGEQIQRYRYVVLSWCTSAVDSVAPKFPAREANGAGPAEALRHRLGETTAAVSVGYPSMEELGSPHPNQLVGTWREAAKACVLAEVDFGSGIDHFRLDAAQARVVLKDAADFSRGIVVLDLRYRNVPGWESLKNAGRLAGAAEVASVFAAGAERDFSVDRHGWRPPPAAIQGPPPPGIAGVVQAQHNMLVDLSSRPPTAMNLRRVLGSQAEVAHEAARHAAHAAPDLVETFLEREQTYRQLSHASRNLGGLVGHGGPAAAESSNARDRLRRTPMATGQDAPSLRELGRLFTGTDARIATTIERGFEEKLYFVSINYPRLADQDTPSVVVPPRERWIPVTSSAQTDLLPIVRGRLRPPPPPSPVFEESVASRQAYEATLVAQPGVHRSRGPSR